MTENFKLFNQHGGGKARPVFFNRLHDKRGLSWRGRGHQSGIKTEKSFTSSDDKSTVAYESGTGAREEPRRNRDNHKNIQGIQRVSAAHTKLTDFYNQIY